MRGCTEGKYALLRSLMFYLTINLLMQFHWSLGCENKDLKIGVIIFILSHARQVQSTDNLKLMLT